ncbi:Chitooligosaccharidolytic beta-N-acetylglucosaminidase [Eumeta japonica]|uniref:Chitooligosaccharidolytic beta-N-acetylglucosaminidase n=1 Tax=Eumeta variegata TaxID=151549 RepID=A0A4C1VQK5_EUMVA|nr:Chitooligosaccharidolytic beta-N-acetylglucosaminidase [Eumeta japonica]
MFRVTRSATEEGILRHKILHEVSAGLSIFFLVRRPSWVFQCVKDKGCRRQPRVNSTVPEGTVLYDTVDVCRTVCGAQGGLWPRPQSVTLGTHFVKIHPDSLRFDFVDAPTETKELLEEMGGVLTFNLLAECGGTVTEAAELPVAVYVSVKSSDVSLTWLTDEQYTLEVQSKTDELSVRVTAETVYGARHGLETFSQLVTGNRTDPTRTRCGLLAVTGVKIKDHPAYAHRGFLLDTSRNFIPMHDIKRMIDGMATTKLNVFHWHVTDTHSFPLESKRVPQFTRYGAYTPQEVYSTAEVNKLVQYARVRGIRVVIEIDAPAHAGNGWQWGQEHGFGDLAVCVNAEPWRSLCIQPPCGQLNPANSEVYRFLKELYTDIADAIPQPPLLHMGGDEVFMNCWNSSQEIVSYMTSRGYDLSTDGYMRLWGEFQSKVLDIWDDILHEAGVKTKQPVMLWSSELTQIRHIKRYLRKDRYVIEVWEPKESPLLNQLTTLGYRVISIPKNVWYLDHGFWGNTKYANWRRIYEYKLPKNKFVLGGEVAMWTEFVDSQALDGRVWPRTASVAERLWSDPSSSWRTSEPRLQRLRTRLVARGLRPDVINPGWCAQNDMRCT